MADAMLFEEAEELLEKAARRNLKIDESDLQKTAQHLFEKQFLLEEVKLDRAKYEIVARYPQYFDMLAYAFGRRLIIDPEKGLVGLSGGTVSTIAFAKAPSMGNTIGSS